jgi:hypothetical protein
MGLSTLSIARSIPQHSFSGRAMDAVNEIPGAVSGVIDSIESAIDGRLKASLPKELSTLELVPQVTKVFTVFQLVRFGERPELVVPGPGAGPKRGR